MKNVLSDVASTDTAELVTNDLFLKNCDNISNSLCRNLIFIASSDPPVASINNMTKY